MGHLETALHLHIMGCLKLKHNSRLIFGLTHPDIDQTAFPKFDWIEFYGNVEEAIPPDMPPPLGKDFDIRIVTMQERKGPNALILDS
jgi:hypothetical protein